MIRTQIVAVGRSGRDCQAVLYVVIVKPWHMGSVGARRSH